MNLREWKEYVISEVTGGRKPFSGDYRAKDKASLSQALNNLERMLKMVQFRARSLNQLIKEGPDVSAHYSMAATNAVRAIRIAVKVLSQATTIMSDAEDSWAKDKGQTEYATTDRAIGILIHLENALSSVVAKGFNFK